MDNQEYIEILGAEIKKIQQANPDTGRERISDYLQSSLKTYNPEQQLEVLDQLIERFAPKKPEPAGEAETAKNPFLELLGSPKDNQPDLSRAEFDNRLATALEAIFRQLNEITIGITASFADQQAKQPTIQKAIMAYIDGTDDLDELKAHLEIVKNVFALTHQAFTQALDSKIREILTELDPEQADEAGNSGGLNFGAFHKAKKFDMLKQKHQTLSRWLDSGLLTEALLKEFERIYQTLYDEKRGTT